jgi:nicotinamide riboside kinase
MPTIAIVGAESTGKTTLAQDLAAALRELTGLRVAFVAEWLRQWCEHTGRTPLAHEQPAILRAQQERIDAAAASHDIVVADTTPLMTAAYSRIVFGDRSLDNRALELHARSALTLLTALDLPWVPDGHLRDGPHVREPVDALLRELLLSHRIPFAVVGGSGPRRLQNALDACLALLQKQPQPADEKTGLFTRLETRNARADAARWCCIDCQK